MKKKGNSTSTQASLLALERFKDKDLIEKELARRLIPLKFPYKLEEIFLEYHFRNTLGLIKFSLAVGLLLYSSFGILDYILYPEVINRLWLLRFGVGCPVILIALVSFFLAKNDRQVQTAYSVAIFIVGLTIVGMLIVTSYDVTQKYYAGVMLVMFYGYVASGMRFMYATFSGWGITIGYLVVVLFFLESNPTFLISNTFFLVSSNLVGMLGSFLFEESKRRDFLLSALVIMERKEVEAANRALEKLSNTDPLTGIANRRYFEDFLEREWKHAMRYEYPISLLMIDIDYFKRYNDHLGHQAGDRCLVQLASVLKEFEGRPGDLVARYGGEEFVVILSGTDLDDAVRIAVEIRRRVMALKILHPASDVSDVVTVSIGVSSLIPKPGYSKEELIKTADLAMYRAKAMGRNCVNAFKT